MILMLLLMLIDDDLGIGSYLSRREFGSNEGQPAVPDSGYVSHSSGGGYPKMEVKTTFNRNVGKDDIKKNRSKDDDIKQ